MNEEILSYDDEEISGELFLENSSTQEISSHLMDLIESQEKDAIHKLRQLFVPDPEYRFEVPRLVCRTILVKGIEGIQILKEAVLDPDSNPIALTAFEALWYASKNQLLPIKTEEIIIPPLLDCPLNSKTVEVASKAFSEIIEQIQLNSYLFAKLTPILMQVSLHQLVSQNAEDEESIGVIRSAVFEIFTEPAIKITRRLISDFEVLIDEQKSEEEYQKFLSEHPVFIDPLANLVIPKQKLGVEFVTDFAIKRLDNEYLLVEIEKPQDLIFTKGNNFSSNFTHAFGQVIDFQEWVDSYADYARKSMPGISSPRGVLVIGRKENLSLTQANKLKRFCINSKAIEILTYDDLITRAKNLYNNLHRNIAPIE